MHIYKIFKTNQYLKYFHNNIYIYIYIYIIYIYIIYIINMVFILSSGFLSSAYRAHGLTIELSSRMISCA